MERVIDYLYKQDRRLISPIGGPRQDVLFRCPGRVEFLAALGFEAYQATPLLRAIKPVAIENTDGLESTLKQLKPDDDFFSNEVGELRESLKGDPTLYWGGGCFGPLTMASDILGIDRFLRYTIRQPETVKRLTSFITSFITDLAVRETQGGRKILLDCGASGLPAAAAGFHRILRPIFKGNFYRREGARLPARMRKDFKATCLIW